MKIHFDLISDLHVDSWNEEFSWEGKATSPYAVVIGDVTRERSNLHPVLKEISKHYLMTMFVDGNDEHRWTLEDLKTSYETLKEDIGKIDNFIFLQDDSLVIDNVAFVGTNGWCSFDFGIGDSGQAYTDCKQWTQETYKISMYATQQIEAMAMSDAGFLCRTIKKLQTHPDIRKIVLITHYVPDARLLKHDIHLTDTHMLGITGNSYLTRCLEEDLEKKIDTWCFGHYHSDIEQHLNGIRFLNNCRGRGGTSWSKPVYYPKIIEIEF